MARLTGKVKVTTSDGSTTHSIVADLHAPRGYNSEIGGKTTWQLTVKVPWLSPVTHELTHRDQSAAQDDALQYLKKRVTRMMTDRQPGATVTFQDFSGWRG